MIAEGAHVEKGMNSIIQHVLDEEFEWLLYVDDDLRFGPDLCEVMLYHNRQRVAPLVVERLPPFRPYIFDGIDDDGVSLNWMQIPPTAAGLIQVPMIAGAIGLIHNDVLRLLKFPWFPPNEYVGRIWAQGDLSFTRNLYKANVKSYVDLDYCIYHAGRYFTRYHFDEEKKQWRPMLIIEEAGKQFVVPL
jgi:hypothetical protein